MSGSTVRLVLASTSVTRQILLRNVGIAFEAMAPGVDEVAVKASLLSQGSNARDIADALAEMKAVKIGRRTGALTLGADQTLELDGRMFDKPGTIEALRRQLLTLRGQVHKLHAAIVLVEDGQPVWREVKTARLTMRAFSDNFLNHYLEIAGEEVLGAVGGYHIEGAGLQLFEKIDGDHFTILGLPMTGLMQALRQKGVLIT